jgi:hypothetical protein
MRKIVFRNYNESPFGLQIEPWAMYEKIAHESHAEIIFDEVDEALNPLEISLTDEGDILVIIMADMAFSVDGKVIIDTRKSR